ncbi:rCG34915, isoform CRA_b [Rattus norvegicus]|nr:rCG34915, isoform CRA_b [Rattus norvegicus]
MKEKGSPMWQAFPLCCLAALSPHIHLLPCHPRPAAMGQLIVEGIGEPKQIFPPSNLFRVPSSLTSFSVPCGNRRSWKCSHL